MFRLDPAIHRRILLVRLSALGDVVYALPALTALHRRCPDARIAWAVEEASADLLRGHPFIDQLIAVPRKDWQRRLRRGRVLSAARGVLAFRRELRAGKFDLAIDLQGNLRGALVAAASGAPARAGFAPPGSREHSHLLLTDRVAVDPRVHRVERNLRLLEAIGVPAGADAAGVLPPTSESDHAAADALLRGLPPGAAFVLLHPGVSRFGSFKQWPAASWTALARLLREGGLSVALSAGPGEEGLAGQIAGEAGGVLVAAGLKLPALAELIRRAAVFVGADTGPTQMAWMLGTPTVALMGPKDAAIYGPLGDAHRKLTADVPCRPCTRRSCADNLCMKKIAVEQVLEAAISAAKTRRL